MSRWVSACQHAQCRRIAGGIVPSDLQGRDACLCSFTATAACPLATATSSLTTTASAYAAVATTVCATGTPLRRMVCGSRQHMG